MTTFFTIIFIFFLLALCALGAVLYKVYASLRKVRDTFGIGGGGKRGRGSAGGRRSAAGRRRRTTHEPVIPREYAVDVQYTEEAITGTESFLDTAAGRAGAFRAEAQVSDAEYEVISDK